MSHSEVINIPSALLREVAPDRLHLSLLALSVAIKTYSPSSVYYLCSKKKFRRDFHLGKQKADKLVHALLAGEMSRLFHIEEDVDGTLIITARSYKKLYGQMVRYGRNRQSLAMHCVKCTCRPKDAIRMADIEHELTDLMLLMPINAKNRSDEFYAKHTSTLGCDPSHAPKFLSVNGLAKLSGMSARNVIRHTQRLKVRGEISITAHPLVRLCNDLNHCPAPVSDNLIVIGTAAFTRQVNDYQILTWQSRHRFQFIIFGHRKRLNARHSHRLLTQSELHEMYD